MSTEQEEATFVAHIIMVAKWGFPFDSLDVRVLAYLNSHGRKVECFNNNLPSDEWANRFIKKHKDELSTRTCQNIKKTRAAISANDVRKYLTSLSATINAAGNPPPTKIINYDETNLSDDPRVKKCLFRKGIIIP